MNLLSEGRDGHFWAENGNYYRNWSRTQKFHSSICNIIAFTMNFGVRYIENIETLRDIFESKNAWKWTFFMCKIDRYHKAYFSFRIISTPTDLFRMLFFGFVCWMGNKMVFLVNNSTLSLAHICKIASSVRQQVCLYMRRCDTSLSKLNWMKEVIHSLKYVTKKIFLCFFVSRYTKWI